MHRIAGSMVLALVLSACGDNGLDLGLPASAGRAIIGGQPCAATDYPSVGAFLAIYSQYGQYQAGHHCTGTLIAPDTVLTAGHCAEASPGAELAALWFTLDLDVSSYGQSSMEPPDSAIRVAYLLKHPDWDLSVMVSDPGDGLADYHDISLAILEEAIEGVAPSTVARADSGLVAEDNPVVIVGYGARSPDQNTQDRTRGVKYHATTPINEVGASEMQVGTTVDATPQKCHGDSGGPSFAAASDGLQPALRQVGITSRAYDQEADCHVGGVDTRADTYRDWIDATMRYACEQGFRVSCDQLGLIEPGDGSDAGVSPRPDGGGDAAQADAAAGVADAAQADAAAGVADAGAGGDDAQTCSCPECQEPTRVEGGCASAGAPRGVLPAAALIGALWVAARRAKRRN